MDNSMVATLKNIRKEYFKVRNRISITDRPNAKISILLKLKLRLAFLFYLTTKLATNNPI